ncbi:uncharacterized protein L969DRAFT_94268 [Mixia osmundae IAM 14324]|uniref:Alpha/beta hydrolase fold-3 domain-containing protein n=1 Tax=Mixia osmundae (strain CBS 9802 / IAM 14324 / JCM 22182 / KY 12970) TaxID=764103 RepID=G7E8C6_MIXOS|nr:uncharacterized protein L969DRAFT_94268 [Mixia osmundae IAM 14324]KEI39189.1 hypothetical protein L969DRAFT_94268 [Mixia osmundae IAM 14324]GAA99086.1 hypothetical protein E5Q_05775 [Mixia osmundae IAM 14324]
MSVFLNPGVHTNAVLVKAHQHRMLASTLLARQPFKAIVLIYYITSSLFVCAPAWALWYLPRSNRPRRSWSLAHLLMTKLIFRISAGVVRTRVAMQARDPFEDHTRPAGRAAEALKECDFEFVEPVADDKVKGFAADPDIKPERVGAYIWPSSSRLDDPEDRRLVMLFCHGGAYTYHSAHPTSDTSRIPRQFVKSYTDTVKAIYSVDFRTSLHTPAPAQLLDAISAYATLIDKHHVPPQSIIITGNSAGGNLCLALARYLRDEQVYPLPGGIYLQSPWSNPSYNTKIDGYNSSILRNCNVDFLNFPALGDFVQAALRGTKPREYLNSLYISPGRPALQVTEAAFKGFPRTFINYGEAEILYEEIRVLIERMRLGGVELEIDEITDAMHDPLCTETGNVERIDRIIEATRPWLTQCLKDAHASHAGQQ